VSATKDWEVLPNSDLADRASWLSLGNDRYAALRVRLLIVRSDGQQSRFGPVVNAYNVAPEDTIELRRRREQVISRTTTISEAIRFTTTSRVCDQLATKVSSELSAKGFGFAGKLGSDILSKSEYEITRTTEEALSATTSHVIQETEEDEHVIKLEGGATDRVAELRRRYWPRRWDVFLHSYEYLELSYKRSWFWRQIRETIKKTDSGALGWPLVSIAFYEPQTGVDVCYGAVANELDNPDSIEIQELTGPMPSSTPRDGESLEELAKLAFPVTKEEKSRAASRPKKKAAPKKAAKKAPAKKAAKKKAAPKKAAKKMKK
jgi:hypothetical protein